MAVEKSFLADAFARKLTGDHGAHHFAKQSNVILRLTGGLHPLDAEHRQILAHLGEGALMQEARQVIGSIRKQLTPAEADEKAKVLAVDSVRLRGRSGHAQLEMRHAQ